MKLLTSISRILVGLLFIFSGIIKSNDPKGTGIKFNEYFDVFASSFDVKQDTIHYSITDDLGTEENYEFTFVAGDSFRRIEFNQSAPRMELFEGETDSTYGSDVFLVSNGALMYSAFYQLGDSIVNPEIHIGIGTGKKVLLDETFSISDSTKIEFAKKIEVFPYVKETPFMVGFFRGFKPYSLHLSVIMCILEVVLGFAILIGWKPKITAPLILAMILFFTFLTWYSAYFNKVTDCGCFGDFIKLKPWVSFWKDIVLLIFILVIYFRRKQIIPLFSPLFSINAMIVVTLASSIFAIYCNMFLPAWDFLPYKAGNNVKQLLQVPKGERSTDSFHMVYLYKKDNKVDSFVYPDMPKGDGWEYVDRIDKIIVPAWKSKIHDFEFIKRNESDPDLKDILLNDKGYSILIVSTHLDQAHESSWAHIKTMAEEAKAAGIKVFAVTSSSLADADMFASEHQLPFTFSNADETLLKTMVRSNPGIMFWHQGTIIDKWSCRSIPSVNKLKKLMK